MNSSEARWRVVVPVVSEDSWEIALAELGELGVEAVVEGEDCAEAYFVRREDAERAARVLGLGAPVLGEAGRALAFGEHVTTELCLELMGGVVRAGDVVCDVGSGSGRLSARAKELGARVVAVDVDWPAAVASRALGVAVVNGSVDALRAGSFDGVVANLHLGLWRELAGEMARVAKPGAWMVASGFLEEQEEEARGLVTRWGVTRMVRRGGWLGFAGTRGQ